MRELDALEPETDQWSFQIIADIIPALQGDSGMGYGVSSHNDLLSSSLRGMVARTDPSRLLLDRHEVRRSMTRRLFLKLSLGEQA